MLDIQFYIGELQINNQYFAEVNLYFWHEQVRNRDPQADRPVF